MTQGVVQGALYEFKGIPQRAGGQLGGRIQGQLYVCPGDDLATEHLRHRLFPIPTSSRVALSTHADQPSTPVYRPIVHTRHRMLAVLLVLA